MRGNLNQGKKLECVNIVNNHFFHLHQTQYAITQLISVLTNYKTIFVAKPCFSELWLNDLVVYWFRIWFSEAALLGNGVGQSWSKRNQYDVISWAHKINFYKRTCTYLQPVQMTFAHLNQVQSLHYTNKWHIGQLSPCPWYDQYWPQCHSRHLRAHKKTVPWLALGVFEQYHSSLLFQHDFASSTIVWEWHIPDPVGVCE